MGINQIAAALARAYVPEWRFDEGNPDAGSVIALLVCDMLSQSEKRLERVMEKYRIEYLNQFDRLHRERAESAASFVRFTQVSGMDEPVHVPKGTQLFADDPDSGRRMTFETSDSITTTPAELVSVVSTDRASDRIARLYDRSSPGQAFAAFGLDAGNEAEHRLLLGFDSAFDALDTLDFLLRVESDGEEANERALDCMTGDGMRYALLGPDGERPFDRVRREGDGVRLTVRGALPQKIDFGGAQRYVISVASPEPREVALTSARLLFSEEGIPADEVVLGDAAQGPGRFLPFGRPMEIYATCGIECRRALARRGARVTMRFDLGFERVEQALPVAAQQVDYKVIMKGPAASPHAEPVTVRADYVLLEYRGERGWRRLVEDEHAALLFNGSAEGAVEFSFVLPRDIAPDDGAPRLRLRLLRADHLYQLPCVHLCPVVRNLMFSYRYDGDSLLPDCARTRNSFETVDVTGRIRQHRPFSPFYTREDTRRAMYLGFSAPPRGMPLSLYFEVENDEDAPLKLAAEYLSPHGFAPISAVDHTDGLLYTGTMLLPVPDDCARQDLFGRDCWWLRLLLRGEAPPCLPRVRRVLTNMVRVENRRSSSETFYLSEPGAPLKLALAEQNLLSVRVFVNEDDGGPAGEEHWVPWARRTGFGERGRTCMIDAEAGTVEFDKDAFAPYPLGEGGPAVRVDYQSYQGKAGNVPAGAIHTLAQSLRYIASVENPMAAYGGGDGGGADGAAAAVRTLLRTRGRAVTGRDYFDLIAQACSGVRRMKCLPGVNRLGKPQEDAVTVALLIEEYDKGSHIFSAVRGAIRRKLLESGDLVPLGRTLNLCQPYFVRFSARVWLSCPAAEDPYELQQRTLADIRAFLDPLTGGFEGTGWEIGSLPAARHLTAWLRMRHPGLLIERMVLSALCRGQEIEADDRVTEAVNNPFAMAVGGEHTVYVALPHENRR